MLEISPIEIVVSIVVPLLIIIIIIYLYKDKFVKSGKKNKLTIKNSPSIKKVENKDAKKEEKSDGSGSLNSRIPSLF